MSFNLPLAVTEDNTMQLQTLDIRVMQTDPEDMLCAD